MNETQYKAGQDAAENASNGGKVAIDEKPYGQTSPDNYSFTYWYAKGWNDYVASFSKKSKVAKKT